MIGHKQIQSATFKNHLYTLSERFPELHFNTRNCNITSFYDVAIRSLVLRMDANFYCSEPKRRVVKTQNIPKYEHEKVSVPQTPWDGVKLWAKEILAKFYYKHISNIRNPLWGEQTERDSLVLDWIFNRIMSIKSNVRTVTHSRIIKTDTINVVTNEYRICPHLECQQSELHYRFLADAPGLRP